MPLYNGGQMHRDWTFVSDIVQGVVAATDRRLGYEIINIGRGEPVLLADFVRDPRGAGRQARAARHSEPMMRADVSYTYANIDKAKPARLRPQRQRRRRRAPLLRVVQERGGRSGEVRPLRFARWCSDHVTARAEAPILG